MGENVIEIREITKQYSGVRALDGVSFNIKRGSCHCLLGENGAGKSTLIKILTGAIKRTSGTILYNGKEFTPNGTKDAMKAGIGCLFQELNVVEKLRVEENICLGLEKTRFGIIQDSDFTKRVIETLKKMDDTIDPKSYVEELSVAKRQVIEISKALALNSDVIIMDEPTAALSEEEVRRLFEVIAELKKQGVTIIYISHRLDEIFEIGDYMTVLRDGKLIGTKRRDEVQTRQDLIQMMIGKVIVEDYIPNEVDDSVKVVEASNLTNNKLKNVSFDLHKGEILGFYGLIGAGKTEIARALFGADPVDGMIKIHGKETSIKNPTQAIHEGIALVPEERRSQGLCVDLSISDNVPMMNYSKILKKGLTHGIKQTALANRYIEDVAVACRDTEQTVAFLSGGNQQKIVFAKCLNSDAKILLLDEPTRGVDVGAKQEIYAIIRDMAKQGNSVIVFSSELPEILGLCDRIMLLYEGEIKQELKNTPDIDSREIMHTVTGGN